MSVPSEENKHFVGQRKVNTGGRFFLLGTASSPGQANRSILWEWVEGGSMSHGNLNLGIHAESCATCHDQTDTSVMARQDSTEYGIMLFQVSHRLTNPPVVHPMGRTQWKQSQSSNDSGKCTGTYPRSLHSPNFWKFTPYELIWAWKSSRKTYH